MHAYTTFNYFLIIYIYTPIVFEIILSGFLFLHINDTRLKS